MPSPVRFEGGEESNGDEECDGARVPVAAVPREDAEGPGNPPVREEEVAPNDGTRSADGGWGRRASGPDGVLQSLFVPGDEDTDGWGRRPGDLGYKGTVGLGRGLVVPGDEDTDGLGRSPGNPPSDRDQPYRMWAVRRRDGRPIPPYPLQPNASAEEREAHRRRVEEYEEYESEWQYRERCRNRRIIGDQELRMHNQRRNLQREIRNRRRARGEGDQDGDGNVPNRRQRR